MFKSLTLSKLKQFQAAAVCMWTQKEAEKIWAETAWKLQLKPSELYKLSDGWAAFCVSGDKSKLEETCGSITARLNK